MRRVQAVVKVKSEDGEPVFDSPSPNDDERDPTKYKQPATGHRKSMRKPEDNEYQQNGSVSASDGDDELILGVCSDGMFDIIS